MSVNIIIPARYASVRYPGKPLVPLRGADGICKPLIQRTWESGRTVAEAEAVFIATDDVRIADVARDFGADVIMTSAECRNGTERCADAVARAGLTASLVVNLQGDSPLTPPWFLSDLIHAMQAEPLLDMATPVLRCDLATLAHLQEDRQAGRVGGTTAVFDRDHNALYFSKELLPYCPPVGPATDADVPVFLHVGVYAYRPQALNAYMAWPEGRLERLEGLEQLRFLENAARIKCVEVQARGRVFRELNNPIDVTRIEDILQKESP